MIELPALKDYNSYQNIMEELRLWVNCRLMILLKHGLKRCQKQSETYHIPTQPMPPEKFMPSSRLLKILNNTIKLAQEFKLKAISKIPEMI